MQIDMIMLKLRGIIYSTNMQKLILSIYFWKVQTYVAVLANLKFIVFVACSYKKLNIMLAKW